MGRVFQNEYFVDNWNIFLQANALQFTQATVSNHWKEVGELTPVTEHYPLILSFLD